MDFIALDFETANKMRGSACSIGLVQVENGRITNSYYSLIKPKQNWFDPFHTSIHGITKEDVMSSPEFDEVWNELFPLLAGKMVVAHNASFDMSVLRNVLTDYDLGFPSFDYSCSLLAARAAWPNLVSHKLNLLANILQIPLSHHDALEDARAAAQVMLQIFNDTNTVSFDTLHTALSMQAGTIHSNGYTPARGKKARSAKR
ncbi:3'-5' exonuclease [Fictibacillus aquaticus]|uniref:Exonuclease domain-containing protein n=1 Tax=Fictibacillus aquaticus TaxID=2021314 RepID=A0A235F9S0_9BACL|nr:3'-5' exonuclease [Fictibacillus aquaticus]OYD58002.1 hypothetical protein CGZ90_08925 [Fictibacillus aquaticus]